MLGKSSTYNFEKKVVIGLFTILFFSYFLSLLNFPSLLKDLIHFGLIIILLIRSLYFTKKLNINFITPGISYIVIILIIYIFSAIYNSLTIKHIIVFFVYTFQFYLMFLAIINLRISPDALKKINKILIIYALLQIPISVGKLYFLDVGIFGSGESLGGERAAGSFGRAAGGLGTTFPLICIGVALGFYLFNKISRKEFIFYSLGFVFFSLMTGKRAFFVVLPPFLILLNYLLTKHKLLSATKFKYYIYAAILGAGMLYSGVRLVPSLNPDQRIGGTFQWDYLTQKVTKYETNIHQHKTTGRLSSTVRILKKYSEDPVLFLWGAGPGSFIKSAFLGATFDERYRELGLEYGFSGFVYLFSQIGILGFMAYLLLFIYFIKRIYNMYKKITNRNYLIWLGGSMGIFLVVIFDIFFYSNSSIIGKIIPSLFYYFLAQAHILYHNERINQKHGSLQEVFSEQ